MIRFKGGGAIVRGISFVAALTGIVNCGRGNPSPRADGTGAVELALTLGSDGVIESVDYMISGATPVIAGTIDVSNANVARTVVQRIPAGKGYLVELAAMSTDGKTSCAGMTKFDVLAGQTTQAVVVMQCTGPDATATGSVTIHGTFDNCPALTSRVATPGSATVGDQIALKAIGADLDGDPLTFGWDASAPIGSFDADDVAQPMFTCTKAGTATLTVNVDDGTCSDQGTLSITCLPAVPDGGVQPDAAPGTGGMIGTGGAGTGGAGIGGAGTGGAGAGGAGTGGAGVGGAGAGGAGTGGAGGGGVGAGGAGVGGAGGAATCDQCTTANCVPFENNGCTAIVSISDKQLCSDLYKCIVDPANACIMSGDPRSCWCGTNLATCYSSTSPPTQANGPCLAQLLAAGKAPDTATVQLRLVDPNYPAGRAVNLAICRSNFCSMECGVP